MMRQPAEVIAAADTAVKGGGELGELRSNNCTLSLSDSSIDESSSTFELVKV